MDDLSRRTIPDEIFEPAMALAIRRVHRDDAVCSECLSGSYEQDHPGAETPSERQLARYFEERWAPESMEAAWRDLRGRLGASGRMPVWRNVCVAGDPVAGILEHYERHGWIGLFWASDADSAHPHNSNPGGPPGVQMRAEVGAEDIDWVATLASHAHPDWAGEAEVRLRPEARVRLTELRLREGWLRRTGDDAGALVPLGALEGRRFEAGDPDMALDDDTAPAPVP